MNADEKGLDGFPSFYTNAEGQSMDDVHNIIHVFLGLRIWFSIYNSSKSSFAAQSSTVSYL